MHGPGRIVDILLSSFIKCAASVSGMLSHECYLYDALQFIVSVIK
jgi:hypothetical protein